MDIELTQDSKVHEAEGLAKEESQMPETGGSLSRRASEVSIAAKVLELHTKGVESKEIAKVVARSYSTVRRIINEFSKVFKELESVGDYKESKADLLAAGQIAALRSGLNEKKLAKTSSVGAIKIFDTLNRAERLERDLSTENVAHKFVGRMEHTKITS